MKKILSLVLALAMSLSLVACGGDKQPTNTDTAPGNTESTTPVQRDDLTVILGAEFTTLDPQMLPAVADINFCSNIFDGLVALDEDGQVVPKLATDWTMSDDGMSYTFHLRQGVKFHNGQRLHRRRCEAVRRALHGADLDAVCLLLCGRL